MEETNGRGYDYRLKRVEISDRLPSKNGRLTENYGQYIKGVDKLLIWKFR